MPPQPSADRPLRILHVIRAPLGGLFRHVLDLTREQIARGHAVGLIADSGTGGATADRVLADIEPRLALGLRRFPMRRNPHPSDLTALARVIAATRATRPDVVHGHGSKGAVYARFPAVLPGGSRGPVRVYTPHGGSLHYAQGSHLHSIYMAVERFLALNSDLMLFESAYIAEKYRMAVGAPRCISRVALNGIDKAEFEPVAPLPDAADFVYVGELREAKGIDTMLDAIAAASAVTGRPLTAVLVGSGPDLAQLQARAKRLGLAEQISFPGPMPARQAFALGRTLVVPSRAESLPYVVLEAAGAQVPMVATRVGGIPEIFGPFRHRLLPSDDVPALRDAMIQQLQAKDAVRRENALALATHVQACFCIDSMVDAVMSAYRDAIAARTPAEANDRGASRLRPHGLGL